MFLGDPQSVAAPPSTLTIDEFLEELRDVATRNPMYDLWAVLRTRGGDHACPIVAVARDRDPHGAYCNALWSRAAESIGLSISDGSKIVAAADGLSHADPALRRKLLQAALPQRRED